MDKTLYKLQAKDISKSGQVLGRAFRQDPVWGKIFKDADDEQWSLFFERPARYCLKFGQVYAPSEGLEGIMAFALNDHADMTLLSALRAGTFKMVFRKGGMALMGSMFRLQPIMAPLEASRKATMEGRDYIYLMVLGVAPDKQGKGHGKKMLMSLCRYADKVNLPIYLETATDKNIQMYEKAGFEITEKVMHPKIHVPQWGMIRERKSKERSRRIEAVKAYIDRNYDSGHPDEDLKVDRMISKSKSMKVSESIGNYELVEDYESTELIETSFDYMPAPAEAPRSLDDVLAQVEESFSQMLFRVIDEKGLSDVDTYKHAQLSRKLFSKIRSNSDYRPSKNTGIALALALGLNYDETQDLLGKAGYTLTRSKKFDIIVEYHINHCIHDVLEVNEVLYALGEDLL